VSLHRHNKRVVGAAAERGVRVEVTRYPDGARTAADAAAAIGCEVAAICKSIVCASDAGPVLVLTSGANRVDYARVEEALGVTGVSRADPDTARAATGFPIGGIPPFGHETPVPVLLDRDLLGFDEIWAAAGTPDSVFPIDPRRLAEATGAHIADIADRRA
jgi:prolyl-tRNA editing enzyme YbaK/EbsC (Cys-tRNA(Pro) deacylase)